MPRIAAFDLLDAVLGHKRLLDEALDQTPSFSKLPERDRGLAALIVRTVLRHNGEIDALIDAFLDTPLGKKGLSAKHVLRIGLAQLLFLDIAEHAAVDTAVELCGSADLAPYRKLVNAILRRAQREGRALLAAYDAPRLNTPVWLWDSWVDAYGIETTRAIAAVHLQEPPLDLTVKNDPAHWAEVLEAQLMPSGTLRFNRKVTVTGLEGFAEGAWWVQDLAASLPARLLGNVEGMDVIDLCAAPGGKTLELAAVGGRVIAVDRSAKRMERVQQNLARTQLNAQLVVADAETWRPTMLADALILDAPCSATGTARRHPDVLPLKTHADVLKLANLQSRLLRAAVDMVRPGGLIVYCTCSLQPEEGEQQIEALLASGAPVELDPVKPAEAGALAHVVTAQGFLRTLPSHLAEQGGMDGFFAARLRRL
ncbi:MAG: methyltransferase domain-containing protein [Rhodospirillales bacterium]|nr:methyltransferase domain-containing protein [Rhodospirillales bacterium]